MNSSVRILLHLASLAQHYLKDELMYLMNVFLFLHVCHCMSGVV